MAGYHLKYKIMTIIRKKNDDQKQSGIGEITNESKKKQKSILSPDRII